MRRFAVRVRASAPFFSNTSICLAHASVAIYYPDGVKFLTLFKGFTVFSVHLWPENRNERDEPLLGGV